MTFVMTTEDECPCTDTSDAASLPLDVGSSALNSSGLADDSTGPCLATNNDCTCLPDVELPAETARASPPAGEPPPVNHQPQRGPFRGTPHFQPALQCICHAYRADRLATPDKYSNADRFNWKWPRREYAKKHDEVREIAIKRNHYRHYSKPYVRGDGTEGIPRRKSADFADTDNLGPPRYTDARQELEEISERIDIYYFDHGNSAYYRTTDSPPILATERCAERTDSAATRFWAEIFGTIHIGVSFVTAFVLQLLRFLLFTLIRPLTVGILQLLADYFVKPLLAIVFNALIQPLLILLYNIATSLRDLCEPVAEALGFFLREVAAVFRAFRIVEVNRIDRATATTTTCT